MAVATLTTTAVSTLTEAERDRLAELEAVVERGLREFIEVGLALKRIRDERLYRASHRTFAHYLEDRWHFSRQRGYQLMAAADVTTTVDKLGLPAPTSERQARELLAVMRDMGIEPTSATIRQALTEWRLRRMQRADQRRQRQRQRPAFTAHMTPSRARTSSPEVRAVSAGQTRVDYVRELLTEARDMLAGTTHPADRLAFVSARDDLCEVTGEIMDLLGNMAGKPEELRRSDSERS
ncbi:MAG TPA: hypothetical protein VFA66_04885 [Gaiellaceae bacterium]|nr:hypothetical protein [Gaiellaceae bacterium]